MPNRVRTVEVPEADRRELERRLRAKEAPAREAERARIVLLAAERVPGKQIAAIVGCAEPTVVTWRRRYAERGLAGLADEPRPGKPSPLPEALRDRVLELTLIEPPTQYGASHWSGLRGVTLHTLRHSAASFLLAAGTHTKVVQEHLGHSSYAITADIYSHVGPAQQREAADRLDQALRW
jgi:transposase